MIDIWIEYIKYQPSVKLSRLLNPKYVNLAIAANTFSLFDVITHWYRFSGDKLWLMCWWRWISSNRWYRASPWNSHLVKKGILSSTSLELQKLQQTFQDTHLPTVEHKHILRWRGSYEAAVMCVWMRWPQILTKDYVFHSQLGSFFITFIQKKDVY